MYDETGIEDCSVHPVPPHKPLEYEAITAQLRFLSGKILTIVDASFSDKEQRKAVKDLVRTTFRAQHSYISRLCFGHGLESVETSSTALGKEIDSQTNHR